MADIEQAHKILIPQNTSLKLKFDAIPLYDKENKPKSYMGMVTLDSSLKSPTSYTYRVFEGVHTELQTITQGTLNDTNNSTFVFPIKDNFDVDYFIQVIILETLPDVSLQYSRFSQAPVVDTQEKKKQELFSIFYTKKVLKERRERINQAKNVKKAKYSDKVPVSRLDNEALKALWNKDDWCAESEKLEEPGTYTEWLDNKAFKLLPLDDDERVPTDMFDWNVTLCADNKIKLDQ